MKFLKYHNEIINFNEIKRIYNNDRFLVFDLGNRSIYFDDKDKSKYIFTQAFLQDNDYYILTDEDLQES